MNRYVGIGVVAILIGGGIFWLTRTHAPASPALQPDAFAQQRAELVRDLAGITPQFIDASTTISSAALDAIKADIVSTLVARDPANAEYFQSNGIDLFSVGNSYVVFRVLRPTDNAAPLSVFSASAPALSDYIQGELLFRTNGAAVFVTAQDISIYKPNSARAVALEGAHLSDVETYDHCGGCMGGAQDLQATHTDHSFTISTFEWVGGKPVKKRDLTFELR